VDCWDYYCYYPWPVEVTVQPGGGSLWTWLGPVLLFGASLVASGVAYFGTRKSNETNQAAITAADNREFAKWRRETVLSLASEASTAALDLRNTLRQAGSVKSEKELPSEALDTVGTSSRLLRDKEQHLRLIGAIALADLCDGIFNAVEEAMEPLSGLGDAKARFETQLREDIDKAYDLGVDLEEEADDMEKALRAEIIDGPQAAFNAAVASVDAARTAFIDEAQRQLNPPSRTG
jgi:hypothetical protein